MQLTASFTPDISALIRKAASADQLKLVLELVSTVLSERFFADATRALVTALATKLGCDRVSLGIASHGRMNVRALSHSATFNAKANLLRDIGAAMEEAADQRQTVVVPPLPTSPTLVTRTHEDLAKRFGAGALCSLPLIEQGEIIGVLTLERGAEQSFDRATVGLVEAVGAVVAPVLDMKRRHDQWLARKAWESVREHLAKLLGPRHVGFKLAALSILGVIAFTLLAAGEYRVTAKTVLEGAVQRAAVAPFEGFLETAPVRAGDVVREGQLLATLQDHDLKLERLKWLSQRDQLAKEYRQVLADREAAKVEIKAAELARAEAQLALATDKLSRTHILAPFDGVVVTGDWSQQLGSPLEEGKLLFEVAPLDAYRVIVHVDERDIASIVVGQTGSLLLSSLPLETLQIRVSKITPVSTATDGRNYFRVEAQFTTPASDRLRPAMEGVAKIDVDQRLLAWIWTHEVTDWVRLKLWAWLP